jgi:hypothetical protein
MAPALCLDKLPLIPFLSIDIAISRWYTEWGRMKLKNRIVTQTSFNPDAALNKLGNRNILRGSP